MLVGSVTPRHPHRFRARSSDGIVELDVEADSYHGEYAPLPSGSDNDDPRMTAQLWRTLPSTQAPTLNPMAIFRFAAALLRTSWRFQRLSFAELLASVSTKQDTPAQIDTAPETLAVIIADFERMCLYIPFRFRCLFRSYFLLQFLELYGIHRTWVFGVALFPFEAHCWVVSGDLLLGERAERVASLSPILIVEPARV